MTVTQKLVKILSGYGFCIKCYCDLDIWPTDLKIYGVIYWPWPIFLQSRITVLFKILIGHGFCIKSYCDLDLVTSKFIGVIYWPGDDQSSYKVEWLSHINFSWFFCIKSYCDLDLWPSDLKIFRGHLLTMTDRLTDRRHTIICQKFHFGRIKMVHVPV